MTTYDLAIIHGDGIGPEVNREAVKALHAAASRFGFGLQITEYSLGAEAFLKTGTLIDAGTIENLRAHNATL